MPEKHNLICNRSWRPRFAWHEDREVETFPQISSSPESCPLICPEYGKNERVDVRCQKESHWCSHPFCFAHFEGSVWRCSAPWVRPAAISHAVFPTCFCIIGRLCTNTTWETASIVKWYIGWPRWQRTYRSNELICQEIRLQWEPTQSECREYTLCCHCFDLQIENMDQSRTLHSSRCWWIPWNLE